MRCLLCYTEDLPPDTVKCPKCGQPFAVMLRDTLPAGYALDHGQYRIEYPVGRGGFGITYRATDAARGFPVAIKEFFVRDLMNRDGSTGGVTLSAEDKDRVDRVRQRFQREGRTLLRVQHPNVVRILDLFEQNDTAYLVMEYLAGQTLRSRMTEELTGPDGSTRWQSRRLPPDEARAIMGSLVAALAAVHEAKIYHLDLKPANILIEPDGRVVLIDFGAARQEVSTGQTVPSYTANYAPPEVMTGKKVGPESDIFEAGMLLYEMLTGALPPPASARMFDADHAASWQPSDIPEPWRGLVASALHLDQTRRPKDVRAWWHTAFPEVPAAERMAPPMAERVAPEVEMIDQTIRERVTLPINATPGPGEIPVIVTTAANPANPATTVRTGNTANSADRPPGMESGGMSTSNNSNNANNAGTPGGNSAQPPSGNEVDNDRTINMRIPPVASRMNTPPPQAIRTDPPSAIPMGGNTNAAPNYDDDNDKTVAMRLPRTDTGPTAAPPPRSTTGQNAQNAGGLQFGPKKAEPEGMNSTTRAIIAIVIVAAVAVLAFVLFSGGRR